MFPVAVLIAGKKAAILSGSDLDLARSRRAQASPLLYENRGWWLFNQGVLMNRASIGGSLYPLLSPIIRSNSVCLRMLSGSFHQNFFIPRTIFFASRQVLMNSRVYSYIKQSASNRSGTVFALKHHSSSEISDRGIFFERVMIVRRLWAIGGYREVHHP